MKPIRLLTLSLLMAGTTAAMAQSGNYRIEGTVPDPNASGMVYLTETSTRQPLDSAAIVNGKFTIEGNVQTPRPVLLSSRAYRQLFFFILEPGNLTVNSENGSITGTPLNEELYQLGYKITDIRTKYQTGNASGQANMQEMLQEIVSVGTDAFSKHKNDALGAAIILQLRGAANNDQMKALIDQAGDIVKNNPDVAKINKQIQALANTAVGKKFVDFSAEWNGKKTSLSDFVGKGKYVLADFWASWCGPCRREIPHIAELYSKYKDKGLVVLGVATWDKPEDTQRAMKELNVTWPQIMNAQYAGSDAYGINGIPQIILFGPDGTILARDLRGEAMTKKIEEVMK